MLEMASAIIEPYMFYSESDPKAEENEPTTASVVITKIYYLYIVLKLLLTCCWTALIN